MVSEDVVCWCEWIVRGTSRALVQLAGWRGAWKRMMTHEHPKTRLPERLLAGSLRPLLHSDKLWRGNFPSEL